MNVRHEKMGRVSAAVLAGRASACLDEGEPEEGELQLWAEDLG